jgi:hypothetical protein
MNRSAEEFYNQFKTIECMQKKCRKRLNNKWNAISNVLNFVLIYLHISSILYNNCQTEKTFQTIQIGIIGSYFSYFKKLYQIIYWILSALWNRIQILSLDKWISISFKGMTIIKLKSILYILIIKISFISSWHRIIKKRFILFSKAT